MDFLRWLFGAQVRVGGSVPILREAFGNAETMALTPVFDSLGSHPPARADAWTFMGSLPASHADAAVRA